MCPFIIQMGFPVLLSCAYELKASSIAAILISGSSVIMPLQPKEDDCGGDGHAK